MTLRVASVVMQRAADLFSGLRSELTAEDLRRNAAVLQRSPAVNTLLPFTLASLEGLNDSKVTVTIEMHCVSSKRSNRESKVTVPIKLHCVSPDRSSRGSTTQR